MQAKISRKLEAFIEHLPRTPRPYFSFNPAPPPTFTRTQPPSISVNSSTHFLSLDHICTVQWPSTLRSGVTLGTHFPFVSRIEERKYKSFSFVSSKTNSGFCEMTISQPFHVLCAYFINSMHYLTNIPLFHQPHNSSFQASFVPSAISVWKHLPHESIHALVTSSTSLLTTVTCCCNPGT